jgi:hypothetical protein
LTQSALAPSFRLVGQFIKIPLIIGLIFLACQSALGGGTERPSNETFIKAFGSERSQKILDTFDRYRKKSSRYNQELFVFVDLKRHKSKKRFYIVYPHTNKALGYGVTHGYGSDRNNDGFVEKVGNVLHSGMSSEGVFLTQGIRPSDKFGHTLHICGLSKSNSLSTKRKLRVHAAKDQEGKDYLKKGLPSAGCFALNIGASDGIMKLLAQKPTLIISSFTDTFHRF